MQLNDFQDSAAYSGWEVERIWDSFPYLLQNLLKKKKNIQETLYNFSFGPLTLFKKW